MLKSYAAERARLLFGCYRKGDANDPETYVAAVTAVLSRYDHDVIRDVTHPAKGLPVRCDFLPTVAEVYRACEERAAPRREAEARKKRIEKQIAERDQVPALRVYERGSAEARAIKVLHEIVGRQWAFSTIFRRSDGSVSYVKPITEQLAGLSAAPEAEMWVSLTHQQAGAWEALLRGVFDDGVVRQRLREGSRAPWPWPPRKDGTISPVGEASEEQGA